MINWFPEFNVVIARLPGMGVPASHADAAQITIGLQDDRVLDFNAAQGDRVFLDPGTTYTVSQVVADTVIDMGRGHQMILVGVQMSMLTAWWIFGA